MARTRISNADLAWIFTEKLKESGDCGRFVSVAIMPSARGWTARADKRKHGQFGHCGERISQIEKELQQIYVLAKD